MKKIWGLSLVLTLLIAYGWLILAKSTPKGNSESEDDTFVVITNLAHFTPYGTLKSEHSYKDYIVRIYEDKEWGYGSYEILKGDKRVYAEKGGKFYVGNAPSDGGFIEEDKRQNELLAMGKDITSSGKPNLVVSHWTFGAHGCYCVSIFEIGDDFRKIAIIDGGCTGISFDDLDKDSKLEIGFADWTFAYWAFSFADSPAPGVTVRFSNGQYRLATELMRKPPKKLAELIEEAKEIVASWKEPPNKYKMLESQIKAWIVRIMLDLIYTGNADQAWQFFDISWPDDLEGKKEFLNAFLKQLSKSDYWSDLQEFNKGKMITPK